MCQCLADCDWNADCDEKVRQSNKNDDADIQCKMYERIKLNTKKL